MNRQQRRAKSARKGKQRSKTLSLPDALQLAIGLHKDGHLNDAEKIYRQIISASSNQPDALNFLGILTHQTGRSDESIELIKQSIQLNPNYTDAYNNLGNVFKELGRYEEAEASYKSCLELDPNNANALSNLGTILNEQKNYTEAITLYEHAIKINPQHAEAFHNLGNALKKLHRIEDAVKAYSRAIALRPYDAAAYKSLGRMLLSERRHAEAIGVFEQWLEFAPDNPIALHMYAACSGKATPGRASDAYVAETFDTFAGSFDEVLKRLEYRAPELILAAVKNLEDTARAELTILDAGCGTGLCGPLLRPYAEKLVGVDLSSGMVGKAKGRNIYDQLHVAELTQFISSNADTYNLIISADTLCYFGMLEQVCLAVNGALKMGGHLVFTLERVVDPLPYEKFRLNPHGRYSHCRSYVEQVLQATTLELISITEEILRKEAGEPVQGMVIVAAKETIHSPSRKLSSKIQ
jgi:predicted TPR repeat methyltransferase